MADDDAHLAAIAAAPDDDAPRRVWADALLERGDPRGELIQLQCALAGGGGEGDAEEMQARVDELLALHGDAWRAPLADTVRRTRDVRVHFRRGLPEHADVTTAALLEVADELLAPHRVRRLYLHRVETSDGARRIAALPALPHLVELSLGYGAGEAFAALLSSPRLTGLRTLAVTTAVTEPVVRAIVENPALASLESLVLRGFDVASWALFTERARLPRLRQLTLEAVPLDARTLRALLRDGLEVLRLTGCALTGAAVRELASMAFPALRTLDLGSNAMGDAGAAALADGPALPALRELRLSAAAVTGDGLASLVRSARWTGLRRLDLHGNALGGTLARGLAEVRLPALRALRLTHAGLGPADAEVLAAAPLDGLATLELGSNTLGDAGAAALAASPHLGRLRRLSLRETRVGDRGVAALAASAGRLGALRALDLTNTRIQVKGMRALGHGTALPELRHLQLGRQGLRARVLMELLASPLVAALETLDLARSELTDELVAELAASARAPRLRQLHLGGTRVTGDALLALARSPYLPSLVVVHGFVTMDRARAVALDEAARPRRRFFPGVHVA